MNALPHSRTASPTLPSWFRRAGRIALWLAICFWGVGLLMQSAMAAAPAGSVIGNQAAATYSDSSAVVRTVTSNLVVTTVQQVASLSLAANGAKTISTGGQVYYPHTLVNAGNGVDTYALTSSGSGSFLFSSVLFYADANGDGVPDNAVPITSTGQLAAGQVFKFVTAGIVPVTAVSGNSDTLTVTATSAFNAAITGAVTDVTTVTGQGVISVTQAIDVTSGPSPAGPRTITITYSNTGNTTVTNLALAELIPSGMTYVAGSGRWSATGATVLTDLDATDSQSGLIYDYGVTTAGRVTAVVGSIAPGASGTVSYKVNINASLPYGASAATASTATFGYYDGATTVSPSNANTVQYTVTQSPLVALTGSTVSTATQGAVVSFTNVVTNNGNGSDSFDITTLSSTFPAGTTFQFFQADGVTPVVDTNGNGVPDTGPLAAGASINIVVKATLPPASTGGPFGFVSKVVSKLDVTKTATANNILTAVTGNTVDLTNDTAGIGALGYGVGPEALAVSTLAIVPGATQRFTLLTTNGSSAADSFSLQASTDGTFAATTLPSGWSVVFRDASGAVVDGTGVVNSGTSKTLYADVTVPAGAAAGTTQFYFRAVSASTGAADRLHDAVSVATTRSLALTPNNLGQLTAGGTTVYSHLLTNVGNVLEADGTASVGAVTSSDSIPGYTSVVYWDRNNNGVLDAGDPVITDLANLTGGTNGASTAAGLFAGESVRLLVKVTAPAGAPAGAANVTSLSVALTGSISSIVAPAPVIATDSTTVIASQVTLTKTQALDANCDGTPETAFLPTAILTGAAPGGCLRYEITASNVGPVAVTNLTVSDATPAYTTYSSAVAASATAGTVTAPANGAVGTVQTVVTSLAPGATVVLKFGVRIDP